MEKIRGKTLKEWKEYSDKDKHNIPIRTKKYIVCLEERIEQLTIPVVSSSTDCYDEGYFYCTNCENKQLASETNDEAICNKCPNDLEFHAYDAGF